MAKQGIQPVIAPPAQRFEKSQDPEGNAIDITQGVDSQIAGLVDSLAQEIELPDDPDYVPVRMAEDLLTQAQGATNQVTQTGQVPLPPNVAAQNAALTEQLKVMPLPAEVVALMQQMQNTFTTTIAAMQNQIDNLSGRRQSASARRSPVIEDVLTDKMEDYVVVVTGRYKFGTQRYDLLQPGVTVTLPKMLGDRLRRSQCVKRPDELYDM